MPKAITKEQRKAIARLYERSPDGEGSYRTFRRRFRYSPLMGAVMGRWCGMTVGIESDGYVGS